MPCCDYLVVLTLFKSSVILVGMAHGMLARQMKMPSLPVCLQGRDDVIALTAGLALMLLLCRSSQCNIMFWMMLYGHISDGLPRPCWQINQWSERVMYVYMCPKP